MLKTNKTKAQLQAELLLANDYINDLESKLEDKQYQANEFYKSLINAELQIADYNSVLFMIGNAIMTVQAKNNHKPMTDIMTKIGNYCHILSGDLYDEDYHDVRVKQLKMIIDGITREV